MYKSLIRSNQWNNKVYFFDFVVLFIIIIIWVSVVCSGLEYQKMETMPFGHLRRICTFKTFKRKCILVDNLQICLLTNQMGYSSHAVPGVPGCVQDR